ncbi:MAG: tripartite tricarboxylate transporter substrate binding protein [Betaproteobacteria bacterium]|nr:tripartite tricarboxylate transporter substrate binding protein [Betaproteobacteria bacterium]MBI2225166.1 tripartite tricarboxylate transporter substrate binding protein [Betaproteobacteria bacterium]MBI2289904.1 tripartite tricarboxylate transporter substrate binding protein [Betaproteobacteria bacterium]
MKKFTVSICVFFMMGLEGSGAFAAAPAYPIKPIRLIVPFPPGGGTDILGRAIGQHLTMALKQNVIVDNRAGGNTVIGSELAARAVPDGHTLLVQINNLTALPALAAGKPLTVTVASFAPVTLVAVLPHLLVVPRTVQASSVKELIALAKAAPKKLTYASAGIGTPVHLGGALFASMAGVDLLHVPYKGAADYTTAVLGAHVDMTFGSVPTALPHIRTGVLKALGATTAKRVKVLPDLPTIAESGLPGYDISSWYGIFAPAGTPPSIVNLLRAEIARGIATKAVMDRLPDYDLIANTPAEFGVFLRKDAEMTARVIARSGATAD